MIQKELWDKFLEVEQKIFKLKFIIQNPLTPDYPILPDFLETWRKDCDRSQFELAELLQQIDNFVEGKDCNK
jgi:hypothetical protein